MLVDAVEVSTSTVPLIPETKRHKLRLEEHSALPNGTLLLRYGVV